MAAIEEACSKLPPMDADELGADTNHLLRNHCPHNKTSISKEENKAIKKLRENQTRMVLTADQGWPWWSWTKRITWTRPSQYSQITTPKRPSIKTPLPDSGTD